MWLRVKVQNVFLRVHVGLTFLSPTRLPCGLWHFVPVLGCLGREVMKSTAGRTVSVQSLTEGLRTLNDKLCVLVSLHEP